MAQHGDVVFCVVDGDIARDQPPFMKPPQPTSHHILRLGPSYSPLAVCDYRKRVVAQLFSLDADVESIAMFADRGSDENRTDVGFI